MTYRRIAHSCIALGLALTTLANGAWASDAGDTVFLRNGGRVRGLVIEETPGAGVRIKLPDGEVRVIPAAEVERVAYESDAAPEAPQPAPVPETTPVAAPAPDAVAPLAPAQPQAAPAAPVAVAPATPAPVAAPAPAAPPPPVASADTDFAEPSAAPAAPEQPTRNFFSMGAAVQLGSMLEDGENAGYWSEGNLVVRLNFTRVFGVELAAGPFAYGYWSEGSEDYSDQNVSVAYDTVTFHGGLGIITRPSAVFSFGKVFMLKASGALGYANVWAAGSEACSNSGSGTVAGLSVEPGVRLGRKFELGFHAAILSIPEAKCDTNLAYDQYGYELEDGDGGRVDDGTGAGVFAVRAAFMWR